MATSLSQEDIHFLRLAGLLIRVAPRAVRRKFDHEFHPERLQQILRENRGKIDNLTYKKRVMTLPQYDLLFPKGSSKVSSDMFDVSLMVCLLRNFTDLDIHDTLPMETIHTEAADICRIKFYRNSIVHSDIRKVNKNKFSEIWNCVAEAIIRLEPRLKSEIDSLISSPLTNVNDMIDYIRLEKELEKNKQHMVKINRKLDTLEIEKNNIKEIQLRTLKEWRDTDKKYIPTSAATFILQSLNQTTGVIITGSPGCGKSAVAHHVALELEKEKYEITPCDDPSEILKHFTKDKFQVFVIDDVCGKFALNQQKVESWEQKDCKLSMLIESCNQNDDDDENNSKSVHKFIITCRENIYVHETFPKLTCFSLVQCSFNTDYRITPEEMRTIALSYVPEKTVNDIENICLYDFFPLLCSLYCTNLTQDHRFFTHPVEIIEDEIKKMKKGCTSSFLCISLLVLRNNKFCIEEFRSEDVQQLVKDICWDCKIEHVSIGSIFNSFESLKGVYITEADDFYTAIHDKMFDIISAAIAPSIMKCLIEHVDIAFLANRAHLSSFTQNSVPFVINIPNKLVGQFLQRQMKEAIKGKYWEVFGSIQTEHEAYRKLLISFLKEQDTCHTISDVSVEDGTTPLYVSSHLGYLDFVKYFIVKSPNHLEVKDGEGRSPFYVACEKGQIAVVRYLMQYNEDINAKNADNTTALSATCLNGHTEVAELLLENKADINFTNKFNQDTLYFACLNGNVKLVKLLLFGDYKVDITNIDTFGQTALHAACQKGHIETVKILIELGMKVNQKSKNGSTPLFLACENGCEDTVKLIIEYIRSKQTSSKKPIADELNLFHSRNAGITVLHVACKQGQTGVVKLLLDVGMNINDTSIHGSSPLVLACKGGHYDTVKFLLDLNNQILYSRIDTTKRDINGWSPLHAACHKGHTEVVKLLIDVCRNFNETSYTGSTPLFLACQKGHFETVKYLLDLNGKILNSRVDTTKKREYGLSALHTACMNGHLDIVKLFVNVGVDLNDISTKGCTPLIHACKESHYEIVKFLLDLNGQTVNSRVDTTIIDKNGYTALHSACIKGHLDVVKLLVNVGVNLNSKSDAGYTSLYHAYQKGHYEIVKYLLDLNGQTINSLVDTTNGYLSTLRAACYDGETKLVKLMIEAGININDTSIYDSTALFLACQQGNFETVKFLLDFNKRTLHSSVDTSKREVDGWSALHAACFKGHKKVVKLLIDVGMNLDDTSNLGFTPLFLACQKGHVETVKYLLDLNGKKLNSRVDTTKKPKDGWSALHAACSNGHLDVVKLLVNVGVDLNGTSKQGRTPLIQACEEGHYEIVKFLLDLNGQTINSRVDTTIEAKNGYTALHMACIRGHLDVVKLLVNVGVNLYRESNAGYTPLFKAYQKGHCEIVKYLLDLNGQTINSRVDTTNGYLSTLRAACCDGETKLVKLMIEAGININDTSIYDSTELFLACQQGNFETVKFLLDLNNQTLDSRVDTTKKDHRKGMSALHVACYNGFTEVVKLLIDVGMNLNDTDKFGSTPLILACKEGQFETVKYLLDLNGKTLNCRVDTTKKREDGWTALHTACFHGHLDIVKLLVNVGLNINDTSHSGYTPLIQACEQGHFEIVKFLLDLNGQKLNSRVDTTIKNIIGWSALHIASFNGHGEILKLLIDVGMNMNERSHSGESAVHLACLKGHGDIVKILKDNFAELETLDSDRCTPFMCAEHKGYSHIMKLLIE